jgi:hypothetical protein
MKQITVSQFTYICGLALPLVVVWVVGLLKTLGFNSAAGIGIGFVVLVALAVCIVGLIGIETTLVRRLLLGLTATLVIVAEVLAMGFFFLSRQGLAGIQ